MESGLCSATTDQDAPAALPAGEHRDGRRACVYELRIKVLAPTARRKDDRPLDDVLVTR